MSNAQALAAYEAALAWLRTLIQDPTGARFAQSKSAAEYRAQFEAQLARTAAFCAFADHPERQFRAVHVAGTSGKGTVTTMIAALLTACGQTAGDHTSPYLQLPNEKLRIAGQMITPSEFATLVDEFRALYARWTAAGHFLKYGEAWVVLTWLWFARRRPAWAVIETGMGGRYDPTNVLPAELGVITNVDYDHVQSLGPTLADIAWHKAGIIKPRQRVVTAATRAVTLDAICRQSQACDARVQPVLFNRHMDGALTVKGRWRTYERLPLAQLSPIQQKNAATAITAVDWLARDFGFALGAPQIVAALSDLAIAGRFEHVQRAPTVILDAAHNPHKMAALVDTFQRAYPQRRATVLLGLIVNKAADGMLAALDPIAARLIVSEPQVFGKPAQAADGVAALARQRLPGRPVAVQRDVQQALADWLAAAAADDILLVTGSLYLIGAARDRWYPPAQQLAALEAAAGA